MIDATAANFYSPTPSLVAFNEALRSQTHTWQMLDACPACAERKIAKFRTIRKLSYSRCRSCGFRFANPTPPESVISAFYNSPFYANYRRLEERRIFREPYFSMSISRPEMNRLAAWLDNDPAAKILDYGCGPGSFLALLRDEFGFRSVDGIELSGDGRRIAKERYRLAIKTNVDALPHGQYDYVSLLEVIEHIPQPDAVLRDAFTLLKPTGKILIATPSIDNPIGLFLPSYADAPYSAPCHVSLFTRKAMDRLLHRLGFEVERIQFSNSWRVIEALVTSMLYELDFVSPQHDDDLNDFFYRPNAMGSLLGREPRRALASHFSERTEARRQIIATHAQTPGCGYVADARSYVFARA